MKALDVKKHISVIKKRNNGIISNYINMPFHDDEEIEAAAEEETIVFTQTREQIKQVYYYSGDEAELVQLLQAMPINSVIEQYYKGKVVNEAFLERAGYKKIAVMQRVCNTDISAFFADESKWPYGYYRKDIGTYAVSEDIKEISCKLNQIFDPYIDHIPSEERICSMIKKKQVLVHKEASGISALGIFIREGKKMFNRTIFNLGEPAAMHSIYRKMLENAYRDNIRYVYTWIEQENAASLQFHKKYGIAQDGVYNSIHKKIR